jgi:hypothetical protein
MQPVSSVGDDAGLTPSADVGADQGSDGGVDQGFDSPVDAGLESAGAADSSGGDDGVVDGHYDSGGEGPAPVPIPPGQAIVAAASGPFATQALRAIAACPGSSVATPGYPLISIDSLSTPLVSFEGMAFDNSCVTESVTSDPSGAIGPRHYVQTVNEAISVYDRAGNVLAGPVKTGSFFSPAGFTGCGGDATGATVVYDRYADRWLISRPGQANSHCLAVSQTSDPTGVYNIYSFSVDPTRFGDDAKIAVWQDGYYLTANAVSIDAGIGNLVSVFERDRLLAGTAARSITFFLPDQTKQLRSQMLPAFVDGPNLPPAGTPNLIVQVQDNDFGFDADRVQIYEFATSWSDPSASTVAMTVSLMPTSGCDASGINCFHSGVCGGQPGACLPQPGTDSTVFDPHAAGEMMYRLTYRRFADHESLLFNHTIAADDDPPNVQAVIRWYEIRRSQGSAWSIFQQGTHAPDLKNRWLGSMAMDGRGDIALGYVAGSESLFPSIRYAGRLVTDPPGDLTEGERSLAEGMGALLVPIGNAGLGRYAEMTVDPVDDCTFWLTNTYVPLTSTSNDWHTRIGAFRFPACKPPPPSIGNPAGYARSPADSAVTYITPDKQRVVELLREGQHDWKLNDLTALSGILASGNPITFTALTNVRTTDSTVAVAACGEVLGTAQVFQFWLSGGVWIPNVLTQLAGSVPGGCAALGSYTRSDLMDVVVYTSADAHVHELSVSPGYQWFDGDLTSFGGVNVVGGPAGYVRSDGINAVVYQGSDAHVHELALSYTCGTWADQDISGSAVSAASDPRPYVSADHSNSVAFRGAGNDIYRVYARLPSSGTTPSCVGRDIGVALAWTVENLTNAAGGPSASGQPSAYVRSDGVDAIVFVASDGHIHEIAVDAASTATDTDLTPGGANAAGSIMGYARPDGVNAVVYTSASDAHVHELSLDRGQTRWVDTDLTSIAGGP